MNYNKHHMDNNNSELWQPLCTPKGKGLVTIEWNMVNCKKCITKIEKTLERNILSKKTKVPKKHSDK